MRRTKADEVRESAAYAKAAGEARAESATQDIQGRVPRLRFPEYRQNSTWVTNKLGAFVDEIDDCNTDNENTVLTLSSENGLVIQEDYFNKRVASKDTYRYIPVKRNDFVYNDRSTTTSPFGTIKRLSKYDKGVVSPIYLAFRPRKAIDPVFLECYFESGCHVPEMNQIVDQGARVGRFNLTPDKFFSINLYLPEKDEQQKIAACLSSLDDLIAAHARKLEALRKYKKGLMQQLFPAEGEKVPRLRFSEFREDGEWEEKSLGDICQMKAGKFVAPDDIFEAEGSGLYPCFGGNGQRGYTKTYTHSGTYPLIGRQGALCGNVKLSIGKIHATEHALVAVSNKDIDVYWLFFCLVKMNLNQYATGQAQPGLSVDVLEKLISMVPSRVDEQQKIASCLSSIDDLIAAQAAKVEELKQHKRGLMQGLFPAPEEES